MSKIYNQTLEDKIISNFLAFYYDLTESHKYRYLKFLNKNKKYTKNDLISIYIPTYNRANLLLERAVSSVLNQTYKNYELIIVGDCCTDDTENKVKSLNNNKIKFFNLQYKKSKNYKNPENVWMSGEVKAANFALQVCKGKWISRLDDDDIWLEDHLEKKLNYCIDNNLEFVSSILALEDLTYTEKPEAMSDYFGTSHLKKKFPNRPNPKIGSHSTYFYRDYLKHFKYNQNCWKKKLNRINDIDLSQRFFKAGVKMGFLNEIVGIVKPRPGDTEIGFKAIDPNYKFD